jgi:hypothetical protein
MLSRTGLALAVLIALGVPAASARTMQFTVAYTGTAHYESYRQLDCLFQNEKDDGNWDVGYSFALPARGAPGHKLADQGAVRGNPVHMGFHEFGHSDCQGAEGSFDCTGDLEPDPLPDARHEPFLEGKPTNRGRALELRLDPPLNFNGVGVTGSKSCRADHTRAFFPAERDHLPGMLQAELTVTVARLRGLAVGHELSVKVRSRHDQLPPTDCSTSLSRCSQVLDPWRGEVVFKRKR